MTQSIVRTIAQTFPRAIVRLLASACLLACLDALFVAWRGSADRWLACLIAAPILPVALFLAAALSVIAPLARLLQGPRLKDWDSPLKVTAIFALLYPVMTPLTYILCRPHFKLPDAAALILGSLAVAALVMLVAVASRRAPPLPLRWVVLANLVLVGAWPVREATPEYSTAFSFVLLASAALVRLPRPTLLAVVVAVLSVTGLVTGGRGPDSAQAVTRFSFFAAPLGHAVRAAVDFDRDGSSAILGGGDCDDLDPQRHPNAIEIVGNGIDDNCSGEDLPTFSFPERAGVPAVAPDPLPDVLFLSVDAARADHLVPGVMPVLSEKAARGLYAPVTYTNAPYTGGAILGIMHSTPIIDAHPLRLTFEYEPSIAQLLTRLGYDTVTVQCLPALNPAQVLGFALVDNSMEPLCHNFDRVSADLMAERVLGYLDARDQARPLFLWAHFSDAHLPYVGSYADELRRADAAIGRLLTRIGDNTIVVFFSDHGEAFGDRGVRGHVWSLDEELLRVVLVITGPGLPPQRVGWPASVLDIAPTITELLGAKAPEGWQGRSLLHPPGTRAIPFESVYMGLNDLRGIRFGDFKITLDRAAGVYSLYDVAHDPGERHNLAATDPARLTEMKRRLGQTFDMLFNDVMVRRKLHRGALRQSKQLQEPLFQDTLPSSAAPRAATHLDP